MNKINNHTCCLCLQKCDKAENILKHKEYKQLILDIVGITIEFNENIPCNACLKCIRVLNIVQNFRETCRQNHLKLSMKRNDSPQHSTPGLDYDKTSATNVIFNGDNEGDDTPCNGKDDEESALDLQQESEYTEHNKNPPKVINGHKRSLSPCYICGKLVNRSRLKYHINTHENKRPFKCLEKDCNKSFPSPFQLKSHNEICHTNVYPFECMICGRKFKVHTSFIIHKSYHLKPELPCIVCGKLLRHKRALKNHMMSHTGERPFQCNSCSKRFQNKYNLEVHQRSHTHDKPFKCLECDKCYGYNWLLKSHVMAKHT